MRSSLFCSLIAVALSTGCAAPASDPSQEAAQPLGAAQSVQTFTLINADTAQPIEALPDNQRLHLLALPAHLNLRADTSPITVGSVRFDVDGVQNYHMENLVPYSLGGDAPHAWPAWKLAPGTHVITATPFTRAAGKGTAGSALTVHVTLDANSTPVQPQSFLAGADIGWLLREQAIPGRVFTDYDGQTPRDPFDVLTSAGINAVRIETAMSDCAVTAAYDNSGDYMSREMNYQLDIGCADKQVQTAQMAQARGMKVVHNINMGTTIPTAWLDYTYAQTLSAIDVETRRQLAPFLAANVQPDIILLENEGTSGMLFTVPVAGGGTRDRGQPTDISADQFQQEICGNVATGLYTSWPKLAGYYKQEVQSARSALAQAGRDPNLTRFGLHSHGQYFDWKNSIVYNSDPNAEIIASTLNCSLAGVIPDALLHSRADQALDIMGWSGYPDPAAPTDPNSDSALSATFNRLNTSLGLLAPLIPTYGRYTDGPFKGQWRKQALIVEYASSFPAPAQTAQQQRHTQMFFNIVKAYDWFLGAMWWEPTYCFTNWLGGTGGLYRGTWTGSQTVATPTSTLQTWGAAASSPH